MTLIDVLAALDEGSMPTNAQLLSHIELVQRTVAAHLAKRGQGGSGSVGGGQGNAKPTSSLGGGRGGEPSPSGVARGSSGEKPASNAGQKTDGAQTPTAPGAHGASQYSRMGGRKERLGRARHPTRALLRDLHELTSLAQRILLEKNDEEQLQNLVWNVRGKKLRLAEDVSEEELRHRKDEAERRKGEDKAAKMERKKLAKKERKQAAADLKRNTQHAVVHADQTARQAWSHLLTLGRIFLIQPELRHILADFAFLGAEVVDQTISDTLGHDARKDLGQQVESQRGTAEHIYGRAKEMRNGDFHHVGVDDVAQLKANALAAFATEGGQRDGGASGQDHSPGGGSQAPNLDKLKRRILQTRDLIEKKRRGEEVHLELPSVDELRLFLREEMALGLPLPEELRAFANDDEAGKVSGIPESSGSNKTTESNGQLVSPAATASRADRDATAIDGEHEPHIHSPEPLSRADIMDMLQLIGVDTALTQSTAIQSALVDAKVRARDVAGKARVEGVKNAKTSWKTQGRGRLLARSRQLLVDVQTAESSQASLLWFLDQAEDAAKFLAHVTVDLPGDIVEKATKTLNALAPAFSLLEKLTGNDLTNILRLVRHLSIGYREDPHLRAVLIDIDVLARRCIKEEGWVLTDECEAQGSQLLKRFKTVKAEYRRDCALLLQTVHRLFSSPEEDTLLKELGQCLGRIGKDLTLGRKYFYFPSTVVWRDLLYDVLPPIFNRYNLPIPRIKYTHPDFVLVLENLAVSLKELLPDVIDFRMTNDFHLDAKHLRSSTHAHSFKLKFKGMSLRVHKVAFALDLLKGVKIHDQGILDLWIHNVGLSIYVDVPIDTSQHYFTVKKVNAKLDKLKVKVLQSNHAVLHRLAEALVDSRLTKSILRRLMASGVTIGLQQLDMALRQMTMLPPADDAGDPHKFVTLKRQAAELRDAIVKMREQAGTLEIDFLDRKPAGDAGNSGATASSASSGDGVDVDLSADGRPSKRQQQPPPGEGKWAQWRQDTHAYKWVKGQFARTGTKRIVRDEWRSNVFDLGPSSTGRSRSSEGASPAAAATPGTKDVHSSKTPADLDDQVDQAERKLQAERRKGNDYDYDGGISGNNVKDDADAPQEEEEESPKEAQRRNKPRGPTTQATVQDANVALKKQERKYFSWFRSSSSS